MGFGHIGGKWGLSNVIKVPGRDKFNECGPLFGAVHPLKTAAEANTIHI